MIWRRLADWVLQDVDWSQIGRQNWVMTWPPFDDPRNVKTVTGEVSISTSLWRQHNGGWLNARPSPSIDDLILQDLAAGFCLTEG